MADPFVLVPVTDPMIGMVVGSFVITRLLGRGGMGAVYLAQHKAAAHIRCVFKTMLTHLSNNALMISRFNIETEAVGRLEHENIVELKDFGVLPNGQLYMQFEFIDGTSLDRFLAEWGGRLSLHRAAYLAFQVCDALDHAHTAGVVHRDLKPDNLLVVVQDKKRVPRLIKIVDFGISKVVRTGVVQTISGMSMGTPYFMSVEQYANAAEATATSDVFSLAIILWLMITGDLPWGRPDPNVLYHLQRTVVPLPPPESVMPASVARVLLRCFSVDPDDRPTMPELAVELAAVVPATDDAPSGGAILMHIAPRFLTSSPDHVRTVPHAAVASPDGVAAQLWPPIKPAAPEVLPLAPIANVTTPASPHALVAPAAPAPSAALPSPDVAVAPAAGASAGVHGLAAPVIAGLPTGLISQKYAAQDPPINARTSVPRVRSVVAASEIVQATKGTPGPRPHAHAELPSVLVSTTQLSGVTSQPGAPQPEPAPFLVLPDAARSKSHRKLVAAGGVLCALAAAASFAVIRRGSRVAVRGAGDSFAGEHSPRPVPGGLMAPGDAGAAEARPAVAAVPSPPAPHGADVAAVLSAGASSPTQSSSKAAGNRTDVTTSPTHPAPPIRSPGQAAASDDAPSPRSGVSSLRPVPTTPPKLVDQPISREPIARAPSDPMSEVTLIIRVKGFATVSIDGDEPRASPRRKRVQAGTHHVVMTGYPDGSEDQKTKEFDVNVPAGRDETIISKTW